MPAMLRVALSLSISCTIGICAVGLGASSLWAQSPSEPTFIYERTGVGANHLFGFALACVDNFAAASTTSVAIGFPGPATDSGFAVVDGPTGMVNQATFTNPGQDARLGAALSASGGVQFATGGLSELLVGFPSGSPGITPSGVTVYAGPDGASQFTPFNAGSMTQSLGFAVRPLLDDVDADGLNDFIHSDPGFGGSGAVFLDDVNQSGGPIRSIFSSLTDEQFGSSIDSIQDIDGGGVRDILVGAPGFSGNGGPFAGAVYLVSSETGGTLTTIEGLNSLDLFGSSLANVGDVDGDGVEDFLVGAPVNDDNPRPGYAQLFKGVVGGAPTLICTIMTPVNNNAFGISVARLGDIDGDNLIEFAIGAPFATPEGSVFISHFDAASGACPIVYTIDGAIPGERFGESLMGAPRPDNICDLNGDNIADFGIGAPFADLSAGSSAGRALFFRGNFPPPPTPTVTPTLTPTPVSSNPLQAQIQFKLRDDGQLDGAVTLNRDPLAACEVAVFGRTSRQNRSDLGPVLRLGNIRSVTQARARFLANGLRRAVCDLSGASYSIHLLGRVRCEGQEIFSNVRARQMSCGLGPPLRRPAWEAQLVDELKFTLSAQRKRARQRARRLRKQH